jgi:hypothetical protein
VDVIKKDCVIASIVDAAGVSAATIESNWQKFKSYHDNNNIFVLTDEYDNRAALLLPDAFETDPYAYLVEVEKYVTMDWFSLLKLSEVAAGSTLYFWIDTSASQAGLTRHQGSKNQLDADCAAAGITIVYSQDANKDYFKEHADNTTVCQD